MTSPKTGMTVKDIHDVYCMDVSTPSRAASTKLPTDSGKKAAAKSAKATAKPATGRSRTSPK